MKKQNLQKQSRRESTGLTRREFVASSAVTGAALGTGIGLFGGKAPVALARTTLHYLQWSSFIPDADVEIVRQAKEFQKATGTKVNIEMINQNDMPARITASISSRSGADVMLLIQNQPHTFAGGLENHNKLFADLGGDRFYPFARGAVTVDGVVRGVPIFMIGNAIAYRQDYFKKAGITKLPQTWDEYLKAGTKLKKIGKPVGQTLGHTFGDAPSFCYPMMWSFGGMEVSKNGKVIVNSKGTRMALEFMKEFWDAACHPQGFAWDDTSNNRAFFGNTIGATLNGASIYFVAKRSPKKFPGLAGKIGHFLNPKGPAGRFHTIGPRTLCIMKHSKNKEAAAEFIKFLFQDENFGRFMVTNSGYVNGVNPRWEKHRMWTSDPKITVFKSMPKYGRSFGYAGPWNRESGEAAEKYIIVDMFARAARGDSPKSAVAWAEKELKNVYS